LIAAGAGPSRSIADFRSWNLEEIAGEAFPLLYPPPKTGRIREKKKPPPFGGGIR
jgi:hypothetical protein